MSKIKAWENFGIFILNAKYLEVINTYKMFRSVMYLNFRKKISASSTYIIIMPSFSKGIQNIIIEIDQGPGAHIFAMLKMKSFYAY